MNKLTYNQFPSRDCNLDYYAPGSMFKSWADIADQGLTSGRYLPPEVDTVQPKEKPSQQKEQPEYKKQDFSSGGIVEPPLRKKKSRKSFGKQKPNQRKGFRNEKQPIEPVPGHCDSDCCLDTAITVIMTCRCDCGCNWWDHGWNRDNVDILCEHCYGNCFVNNDVDDNICYDYRCEDCDFFDCVCFNCLECGKRDGCGCYNE